MTVFFDIAYQGLLPSLVGSDQLLDGNSKLATSESGAEALGPGIAGVFVTALTAAGAVLLDMGTYLVSAMTLLLIGPCDSGPAAPRPRGASLLRDVKEGLQFIARHDTFKRTAAFAVTANTFASAYNALEILFLVRDLHAKSWMVGIVLTMASTGGVLAALAPAPLGRAIGATRLMWLPLVAFGCVSLLIPFAQPGWGVLLVGVGTGANVAGLVIYGIAQLSLRQRVCPPELLNRVAGSQRWVAWCAMPLGSLLGGALGTQIGVRGAIAVSVTGGYLSACWLFFSPLRRSSRVASEGPGSASVAVGAISI